MTTGAGDPPPLYQFAPATQFPEVHIPFQLHVPPAEDVIPPFQFNEDKLLAEIKNYIEATYSQHYSQGKNGKSIQVVDFILSNSESPDFLKGNVLKYTIRYGRKEGNNRKDLMKALHYLILLLNYHDEHNT